MSRKSLWWALSAATLVLVACGGGGSDDSVQGVRTVPASALASPEAWVRFVAALIPSDRAEPLDLSGVVPPVSETDEPLVIR